jgi:THO complex subunit 2
MLTVTSDSPGFYVTFWQLSTYDLMPPGGKYDEEVSSLRALSRQEDSKYIAADRSADRAKRLTASSHRIRRARYNDFVNLLAQEYKEQAASRVFTIKRLAREKQHWFAGGKHVPAFPKPGYLLLSQVSKPLSSYLL